MNSPFRELVQKKKKATAGHRSQKKAEMKGTVVDLCILPEFALNIRYVGTRHDN